MLRHLAISPSADYIRQITQGPAYELAMKAQLHWERYRAIFEHPNALRVNELAEKVSAGLSIYDGVRDSMLRMQASWVDTRNALGSAANFAAIFGIGRGIQTSPFTSEFTASLRTQIGDWRDVETGSAVVIDDPGERTELYLERGFRAELVDFPPDALDEIVENAGLNPPDFQESLIWRDRASPYIGRIEMQLRVFVNEVLTEAFGEEWIKRIDSDTIDRWKETERKRKAEGRPEAPHLIHYSEFTDLLGLMKRRDHFPLFKPVFKRVESLEELFNRVVPARHAVAHLGIVTPIDYFTVLAEYSRLRYAIERTS